MSLLPQAADPALGFLPGHAVGLINVSGLANFQGGVGATGEYAFHFNSYQIYDDLYYTKGSHSLKGVSGRHELFGLPPADSS